jgi:hypothetical protein
MAGKLKRIAAWFGRVLGAAAPFVPDPKAKLAIGAASAVLNEATKEQDDGQDTVSDGVQVPTDK